MPTRHARSISSAETDELLALDEKDITSSCFMELFGEFNEKSKFNPYDEMVIPIGGYGINKKNKNNVHTTVGIFIWNKYFLEHDLEGMYINEEINKKRWNKLMNLISQRVLEDELSLDVVDNLLIKAQKVMGYCSVLSSCMTDKFLNCTIQIEKQKKELAKKYKKELEEGDLATAVKMEKELLAFASEYLKDDPSLDTYNSGARSSFGNNFKNMYIMKGAIRNPDPNAEKQFNIALSCYNNGISKEEYGMFCAALTDGTYKRANKTAIGGYWEKLFLSAFQHIKAGPKGSDCGTKDTLEVQLTEDNIGGWMYSYVVDRGNLVELTSKTYEKYLGKTVRIRFSALCEYKKDTACICNACLGNLYYRIGTTNVGIILKDIASVLKNKNMKAFHDSTMDLAVMDVKKAFGE